MYIPIPCNSGGRHLRLGEGGGKQFVCVRKHIHAGGGGLGVCFPRKILQIRCSEIALLAQSGTTVIIVICIRLHMYDSNLYRHPHAMQWPLPKGPNF